MSKPLTKEDGLAIVRLVELAVDYAVDCSVSTIDGSYTLQIGYFDKLVEVKKLLSERKEDE